MEWFHDNAASTSLSADPGLCHGRGGAWDHRRCGTCFLARLCLSANLGSDSSHSLCFEVSSSRGRPFLQLQQVPEAVQQVAEAVAVSFYGGSRLSFASLENSPNSALQLPGATQVAADLSCSSNKCLRPWQCQGCRLPGLKTRQTLPCSSQAPLRPRQTFPAAPTSPWPRGSVLLWRFKAVVCQPWKLAKPFPAAPRRHSGRGRPFLQPQQSPEAVAVSFYGGSRLPFASLKLSSAAPRRHSGRGRPFLQLQQGPEAVAVSFYGGSRLPFASLEDSPNPSLQLPVAHSKLAHASLRAAFLHAVGPRQPNGCYFCFVFVLFFSGTCHCLLWHGFPDGMSCLTAMRPHDSDDQTTVEQTGQLCAWCRVCLLTSPSLT